MRNKTLSEIPEYEKYRTDNSQIKGIQCLNSLPL